MTRLAKVSIAAINATATGGCCELSLACDLRYMADRDISIGLPEMTLGFNPGAGGTQRLTRALGTGRALEMMLEGRTLSPREALEVGLVQAVVEPSRLLEHSLAAAHRMARRGPVSIRGLKQAVYEGASSRLGRGLHTERKWFMSEGGKPGSKRAMTVYTRVADEAPWLDPELRRAWQEGTAADVVDGTDGAESSG